MTPWENPSSYEAEPETPHGFDGIRQLSGYAIAFVIVIVLLIYGIIKVSNGS